MDKSVAALSNIELNALLLFCQCLDTTLLDIPYYHIVNPVLQDCEAPDDSHKSMPCSAKDLECVHFSRGVKLAGLTKRGMSQPARRRR